jgi:hypothetical protein
MQILMVDRKPQSQYTTHRHKKQQLSDFNQEYDFVKGQNHEHLQNDVSRPQA